MKFKILIKQVNTGESWWEEYNENTNDAQRYADDMIQNFNATLRPNESPRQLLKVEVLDETDTKHEWVKLTSGQSVSFRGNIVDLMRCPRCGITGKRYGLSSKIKRDSKYRAKRYDECSASRGSAES